MVADREGFGGHLSKAFQQTNSIFSNWTTKRGEFSGPPPNRSVPVWIQMIGTTTGREKEQKAEQCTSQVGSKASLSRGVELDGQLMSTLYTVQS